MDTVRPTTTLTRLQWKHFYTHYRWSESEQLQQEEQGRTFPREPVYAFMRRFEQLLAPDHPVQTFEIHTEGTLIGVAHLDYETSVYQPRVSLSICTSSRRRRGHGSAALRKLLSRAFEQPGVTAVEAATRPSQTAWQRLLERHHFHPGIVIGRHRVWRLSRVNAEQRTRPLRASDAERAFTRRARAA